MAASLPPSSSTASRRNTGPSLSDKGSLAVDKAKQITQKRLGWSSKHVLFGGTTARPITSRQRRIPRPGLFAPTFDHALVAAGVMAAVSSATFAGFMITHEVPPIFGGAEHLMLFARPLKAPSQIHSDGADRQIDYQSTGTIERTGSGAGAAGADAALSDGEISRVSKSGARAKGYFLNAGSDGISSIDGPGGSYAAEIGTVLPEAGRIVLIERRGGKWIAVTSQGVIIE
jgi:hypothetical protein